MDNLSMQRALEYIIGTQYHFEIIPASELGQINFKRNKDSFIIVHIPLGNSNFGHWIAFEISCVNYTAKYFDSYGLDVHNYVDNVPFQIVTQNDRALQSPKSDLCGVYVCYFVYHRVRSRLLFCEILSIFVKNTEKNDIIVKKFYSQLLNRMPATKRQVSCKILKTCCMTEMIKFMKDDS